MATALTLDALPHQKSEPRRRRRERPATLTPGQSVGAWRVERELGHGGMGSVYAITHKTFGKRAALKLCHRGVLGPDFTAATFLREARVVNLIDHPGVPDVFATGSYDGRPYLAMERLRGQTLGDHVRASTFSTLESIALILELCDILSAAHASNVVHRDLKLDNVFVVDACPALGLGRRVKLLDWGVAHVVGEPDPLCGVLAGTLTYIAPEQVRGDALTPAADVYSLAVLIYQCLLRRPPFA
ncbi:MAG: serine/threonine protein kinase, partial [Deltaproteobacteria bacterium]|nr:serine/threonine protein kinase [Deltaproteobacteria bacterium]